MRRLVWLSDIHLNAATRDRFGRLLDEIDGHTPDAIFIGGDTAETPSIRDSLAEIASHLAVPVYFVLGNHDYYRGSIAEVRQQARTLSRESEHLIWLPDAGVIPLGPKTALIGHGGWGDARSGDFIHSDVVLNDYLVIEELRELTRLNQFVSHSGGFSPSLILTEELQQKLQALGDEAADHFRRVLPAAVEQYENILVLMHVPPFREACRHEGRISDDNWAPHFTCLAAGRVLTEFMQQHPDRHMTVLCGHTHGEGQTQILENLEALTASAQYGNPRVQQVFDVE